MYAEFGGFLAMFRGKIMCTQYVIIYSSHSLHTTYYLWPLILSDFMLLHVLLCLKQTKNAYLNQKLDMQLFLGMMMMIN